MKLRTLTSWLLLTALSLPVGADTPLPDVGSSATQVLSAAQENALGDYVMEKLRAQQALVNDPQLAHYIQSLGERLVKQSEDSKRQYHFFIVDESHVNAFALPGAWIGVHAGLILQTRRESELAAVMAHEVAHVSQRHISRMFEKAKQMSIPSIAALIGAAALSIAVPGLGNAAIAGVMATTQQAAINFTRHNEQEADRIGIDILANSSFDVNSMSGFFGRMQELSRYNDTGALPEFLRTHPMSTNRMADAQSRAGRYPNKAINENTLYPFMKERLRAICLPTQDLRAFYSKADLSQDSVRYGKAMSILRLSHDPKAAREMLAPLISSQMLPPVAMFQAALLAQTGDVKTGLQLAEATLAQFPDNKGLTLELADLYLKHERPEAAKTLIRRALLRSPDDADYHGRLSRAYTILGDRKLAYLAKGDQAMSFHLFERAMFALKSAEKEPPKTPYYQSLIEAKINENEALLAKQKKIRKSLNLPAE